MTRLKHIIVFLMCAMLLNGCILYRLDIPQGNEVTADKVALLKPGQTKAQIQYVLGTPLLRDPFHEDRWDYVYYDSKAGKIQEEKKFTVFFENGVATRWEGDVLPATERARLRQQSEASTVAGVAQ
jgi:outer membrane protein assembly factor BamE